MSTKNNSSKNEESQKKEKNYPLRVAFIHPDLGIGGAEQFTILIFFYNFYFLYAKKKKINGKFSSNMPKIRLVHKNVHPCL